MVKKTAMIALAAAFATLPGPILADVDRFGEARMAAIEVVFERALQNPEADVDRLSPARWSSVLEVYDSHPPSILVDELPHSRWVAMQAAYDTLDRGFEEIALAN